MGKSTISMVIFNSYVKLPEGKVWKILIPWLLSKTRILSDPAGSCRNTSMGNPMKPQWLVQGHVPSIPAMGFWAAAGAAVGWSHVITQNFAKWLSLRSHWETLGMFSVVKSSRPWPSSQERTAWSPSLIRWRALRCRPWDFQHEKIHLFDGEMPSLDADISMMMPWKSLFSMMKRVNLGVNTAWFSF